MLNRCHSLWIFIAQLFILSACQEPNSVFNPRGEGAKHISDLWLLMLLIATLVFVQVIVLLLFALFRNRPRAVSANELANTSPPTRSEQTFIIANGIAIPVVILVVVFGLNLATLAALSPPNTSPDLLIEVIGHRWWWEVRYPDHDIVTANEIHIPIDKRVELRLTSEDVIHSLWIPVLNGKIDLIPGQSNRMYLLTGETGTYDGACAELCGVQHAKMLFQVVAQPQDDFDEWIAIQQQAASEPEDDITQRGQQIFLGAACVYCHTIRGTSATGVIGPDLTHFASRAELGAGAAPNTPGHLAGWIIDPQATKPGNLMPPMYLEGDDLQALLAYMEMLK